MHEQQQTTATGNPFAGLLNLPPRRNPVAGQVHVVVNGKRVAGRRATDIVEDHAMDDQEQRERMEAMRELKRERRLSYYRNHYQKVKNNPVLLAKRKAKQAERAQAKREYQARYRLENAERIKQQKREHAARKLANRTDADRQKRAKERMAHYYRNHEQELERGRAYRAKNREAIRERTRLRALLKKERARLIAAQLLGSLEEKGGVA